MKRMPFASYRSGRAARSEQHQNRIPHRFMIYGMLGLTFAGMASVSCINNQASATSSGGDDAGTVGDSIFSGIGHYNLAVAGNNNVYHGDSYETEKTTSKLIAPSENKSLPTNWSQLAQSIATMHGKTAVDNLSGSKLNIGSGTVKKAWFRDFHCDNNEDLVTIIGPKGGTMNAERSTDLTSFVSNEGDGWYYVTYKEISATECNQASWSIATVYEDPALPISRVELVNSTYRIANDTTKYPDVPTTRSIKFQNEILPDGDTDLLGVYIAAGRNAWDEGVGGATTGTGDKTSINLKDGTSRTLAAFTDKGGTLRFAGREANNFAKIIFKDVLGTDNLSHNIAGGELDVFFEKNVDADLTNGQAMLGYTFEKLGNNILSPAMFGYRQGIEAEISVTPHIPADNPTHPTVVLENTSNRTACAISMSIPLSSIGKPTEVTATPSTGVTHEISGDNLIVKVSNMAASAKITLNLTVPESTNESIEIHPVVTYFPSESGTCSDDITGNSSLASKAEGTDTIYRVLVQYQDESGKELHESTHFYAHSGDDYTTKAAAIEGYTLIATPDNHEGVVENKAITVTYVYKPTVAVPNTGLFTGDKNYLLPVGISVAGLAGAGLAAWFIRRKLTSKHVGFNK